MAPASRTLAAGGHFDLMIEFLNNVIVSVPKKPMCNGSSASSQNQALSAILFLYRAVLQQDIGWVDEIVWAKKPKRLPVVLTREEVKAVLQHLSCPTWLMASLLYGSGLRLSECLRLRVKDVDVAYHQITGRDGKGAQDRVTMLPERLKESLQAHLHTIQQLHQRDLEDGFGNVYLPDALGRKYPNASREWAWQYVFPAARRSRDPRSGTIRRHHVMPLVLQCAVKAAVRQTDIAKAACHSFRHYAARQVMPSPSLNAHGTSVYSVSNR
jgi:integron integrase